MIPFSLSCPEANITLKLDVNYYGKIRVNCAVYSQKIPQKCRKMQAVLPLAGVDPLICNHLHDASYASIPPQKIYAHILLQILHPYSTTIQIIKSLRFFIKSIIINPTINK